MDGVYNWIKDIAFYMILITLIVNVLPDSKYQKYIKLFSGMVMVLLVIKPLTNLFQMEDKLAYYFDSISFAGEMKELHTDFEEIDNKRYEAMMGEYEKAVSNDLAAMALEEELYQTDAAVAFCEDSEDKRFGKVILIQLWVSQQEGSGQPIYVEPVEIGKKDGLKSLPETASIVALREKIVKFYDIEPEAVEIKMVK